MNEPAKQKSSTGLTGRRTTRRRIVFALWTAAAAFSALVVWCGIQYVTIVSFQGLAASDRSVKADAGIVLGASLWNDKPSPGLKERLDHALRLYRAGMFPRIIVTGGLDAGGAAITEAEGMRDYLVEQGVPENAIRMDKESRNTYENLRFAQVIMKTEGWKTAVIVTHSYHGARAGDIARSLGYDPVLVSVTDSKVMMMPYHNVREILAMTKWKLTKLRLSFA